ncbi:hypothetical protein, partial [Klebsiella quasipneumoniae]|uniref:hypothetical protein n=1 Tax=Klebsiella quasipneumoniae TaxID=1463165 RepID=UPI0034D2B934
AAPPGRLYPTPFPSLCRMTATPYPAYGRLLNLSYQTVAQLRRPAQAQRRRAGCIRPTFPFFNASIAPAGGSPLPPLPPQVHTTRLSFIAFSKAESLNLKAMQITSCGDN